MVMTAWPWSMQPARGRGALAPDVGHEQGWRDPTAPSLTGAAGSDLTVVSAD